MEPFGLMAQEDLFFVYDINSGFRQGFEDYDEAYSFYRDNLEEYDDLILSEKDDVIMMEYGIVEFESNGACDLILDYHSLSKDRDEMLNGCYGIDATYISTSSDGKEIEFLLNGDHGAIAADKVVLHPLEELDTRISSYSIRDGLLYHDIKSQFDLDYYTYSLALSKAPSFLKSDKTYYSGDGHYFYEDLKDLIDDLVGV